MAGGGVGEMLVSAVVKEVLGKLGSPVWGQIGLMWGFRTDMKEMKRNLEMLEAVLDDAERKSIMNKPVCLWLKELKLVAYDIGDMMCDFETELPPNNTSDGSVGRLHKIISLPKAAKKRFILANQIKDMKKRLEKIAIRRSQFNLSTQIDIKNDVMIKKRETFSDINEENSLLGRDKDKEELMRILMRSHGREDVSIIAIIGLGGIGKTTLVQLLYNDDRVIRNFNQQGWVYVSMEFDLKSIASALLESFGGSTQIFPSTLEGMRANIKEKISGKKYCIVLDDVWEEDGRKLEELRGMLQGGIKGSKIVVTTRSEKVAMQICAAQSYKLEVLSDYYCWNIFSQRAFTCESEKNDKELEVIGREIVKKCGGIPLAAKALGYTMRSKKGVDAWSKIKNSDIWKLDKQSEILSQTSILPSLKLSFYFLPSYLKLCFEYCSIFPKGYRILRNELIQQWIALGFIEPMEDGLPLEERGEGFVNDLLDMSFLQFSGNMEELYMHDLVHDLARSIIGDDLLVLDAEKDATNNVSGEDHRYALLLNFMDLTNVCRILSNKIRAIHFCSSNVFLEKKKIQFLKNSILHAKCLRVIHFSGFGSSEFPTSMQELKQLRYLRAPYTKLDGFLEACEDLLNLRYLDMSHCGFSKLPKSFGNLLNLRYLDMSYCEFNKLPKSFPNLTNLQILKFNGCSNLEILPEPFNLVCLQELYLYKCAKLRNPPKSSNLISLKKLDMRYCPCQLVLDNMHGFVLVGKMDSKLYDVIEINKMAASVATFCDLEICCLENLSKPEDVAKANLHTKSELNSVKLKWTYPKSRSLEDMAQDEAILENLMPHQGIKSLILDGYSAPKFPSKWLLNIGWFLPNLSSLDLKNMIKCDHLPSLGLLPNLLFLTICNMPNLRKVDNILLGGSREAFRRLKALKLHYLLELEEWPTKLSSSDGKFVFTNLQLLEIKSCPQLKFEPSFPRSRGLFIKGSLRIFSLGASQRFSSLKFTKYLTIRSCILELDTLPLIIRGMTSLTTLAICCCNLIVIPRWLEELISLKSLAIVDCSNFTVIPEWLGELNSLEELAIYRCDGLDYFPCSLLDDSYIKDLQILSRNQILVKQLSGDNRFNINEKYNTEGYTAIMFNKAQSTRTEFQPHFYEPQRRPIFPFKEAYRIGKP